MGLDFCQDMLRPKDSSNSHIIAGNRMRYQTRRRACIEYDGAWLASNGFSLKASLLLPGVASLNQRLVYSNDLLGEVWPLSC